MIEFILVSGGDINIELLSSYLKNKEYRIMAIDKGIEALSMINVKPDYILGDFDSVDKSIYESYIEKYPDAEVAKYNAEKDYTDTELGIRTALKNGASSITIFGGTGTRLDHTIANIRTLNIRVDTARDLALKLYNTSNETIKTAWMAENAVCYAYRIGKRKYYFDYFKTRSR